MNWKLARSSAKVINILFLFCICKVVLFLYSNEIYSNNIYSSSENQKLISVSFNDSDNFLSFTKEKNNENNIECLLDISISENFIKEKYIFIEEIINHRLSLVYLFSIFFSDLVKLINRIGVI